MNNNLTHRNSCSIRFYCINRYNGINIGDGKIPDDFISNNFYIFMMKGEKIIGRIMGDDRINKLKLITYNNG